jgi:putative nucleotidyltransferase with HDIG domain
METINQLVNTVEILPPAPNLLTKLLLAINDIDANFDEIVNFIQVDPSLTAKLLQICNSAFFGSDEPLVDVRDAVSRIGYQSIYLLVSMIKGSEAFRLPAGAQKEASLLWKHSVTTAFATQFVAEAANIDKELAFTSGLLHDLGKIIFYKAHSDHYKIVVKKSLDAEDSPYAFEIASFGFSHAELGASLLEKWNLPAPLVQSVKFHHSPHEAGVNEKSAASLYLGNMLAHGGEYADSKHKPLFISSQGVLNLTKHDIEDCNQKIKANWSMVERMCYLA